ncbi:EPS I polysaccharide export inner membrane protein EpsF [Frankliniella fusca]|uniref:EPS I polysaccharide export inner membrane protein EpsF n=1 Tax=Frankliniella fusca TaxID=407009 RepID=A0AAE1HX42_9NEOP|nr:EPS I polysaccharide export inner membrane protein EpsF [Frankliniella fusca]
MVATDRQIWQAWSCQRRATTGRFGDSAARAEPERAGVPSQHLCCTTADNLATGSRGIDGRKMTVLYVSGSTSLLFSSDLLIWKGVTFGYCSVLYANIIGIIKYYRYYRIL